VQFTPPPTSVRYWDIVSALSVGLVEAGNMASGSWCDSAFTKNVPWLDDGDSSSSNEEELMLLYSVTNRTHWVHPINQRREQCDEYHHLMKDLELYDDRFTKYFRLSKPEYEEILILIRNDISKKDTNYGRCISSRERLAHSAIALAHSISPCVSMVSVLILTTKEECSTIDFLDVEE
ncbi:hypothetical protein J6590_052304, partial [Homalodisca vitripennis]